jgi:hypothetical protein
VLDLWPDSCCDALTPKKRKAERHVYRRRSHWWEVRDSSGQDRDRRNHRWPSRRCHSTGKTVRVFTATAIYASRTSGNWAEEKRASANNASFALKALKNPPLRDALHSNAQGDTYRPEGFQWEPSVDFPWSFCIWEMRYKPACSKGIIGIGGEKVKKNIYT